MLVTTDAAAGTGSDQAEGSQPDGPGRHRHPQETENGLTGSGCQRRGKERLEVASTEMLSCGKKTKVGVHSITLYFSVYGPFS